VPRQFFDRSDGQLTLIVPAAPGSSTLAGPGVAVTDGEIAGVMSGDGDTPGDGDRIGEGDITGDGDTVGLIFGSGVGGGGGFFPTKVMVLRLRGLTSRLPESLLGDPLSNGEFGRLT